MSLQEALVVVAVATLASTVQTVAGFGFALLAVPLMSLDNSYSLDGRVVFAPKLGKGQLHLGGSIHQRQLNDAKKNLERPYDPQGPLWISYTEHQEIHQGTDREPKGSPPFRSHHYTVAC